MAKVFPEKIDKYCDNEQCHGCEFCPGDTSVEALSRPVQPSPMAFPPLESSFLPYPGCNAWCPDQYRQTPGNRDEICDNAQCQACDFCPAQQPPGLTQPQLSQEPQSYPGCSAWCTNLVQQFPDNRDEYCRNDQCKSCDFCPLPMVEQAAEEPQPGCLSWCTDKYSQFPANRDEYCANQNCQNCDFCPEAPRPGCLSWCTDKYSQFPYNRDEYCDNQNCKNCEFCPQETPVELIPSPAPLEAAEQEAYPGCSSWCSPMFDKYPENRDEYCGKPDCGSCHFCPEKPDQFCLPWCNNLVRQFPDNRDEYCAQVDCWTCQWCPAYRGPPPEPEPSANATDASDADSSGQQELEVVPSPAPTPYQMVEAQLTLPPSPPMASDEAARLLAAAIDDLRDNLGRAWDAFASILTFKSGVFDQRVCATRALRDLATLDPANLPLWFLDWFYVLYSSERALWQMLSLATLSASSGLMQGYRLFRAVSNYLMLFWQAHVTSVGTRMGGLGMPVWEWLSPQDLARGVPG
jgi:hypothetical protein